MKSQILLSLMDFPFSAGTKDSQGFYNSANNAMAEYTGKNSVKDLIGVKDSELSWKEGVEIYRNHDKKVEKSGKYQIFLEPARKASGQISSLLCIKAPLNQFIENTSGIAGATVPLSLPCEAILKWTLKIFELLRLQFDYQALMKIITNAMKFENLQTQWKHNREFLNYGTISLTLREAQCLHYFFHNYSAEKTSENLCISKKTVEFHLAKIKEKLNCTSSEIVNKAIDEGFIELMFMKF